MTHSTTVSIVAKACHKIDIKQNAGLITREEAYQMACKVNELATCFVIYGNIPTEARRQTLINNLVGA